MPLSADRFRKLVLALPDCEEGSHHNHTDFRCAGRVFATIHPGGETVMVKLPAPIQANLVARYAAIRKASGAWGRAGCTLVTLRATPAAVVGDAVREAWQFAASMAAGKRAKK